MTKREAKRSACRIVAKVIENEVLAVGAEYADDEKIRAALLEVADEMRRRGGDRRE